MEQETEIINTNTKIERVTIFFKNNKKSIISIIFLILLSIFAYFSYKEILKKEKIKLADRYNNVVTVVNNNNKLAIEELKQIILAKDETYSPLALYYLIDNSLISSKNEINGYFNIILEKAKLEKEIKNLIIYKKALYNSEFETEENLIQILNPIINSESVWKSHALLLMAEYYYSKGEKEKSKEFFQNILNLKNKNQMILVEAQKRIQRDFSE